MRVICSNRWIIFSGVTSIWAPLSVRAVGLRILFGGDVGLDDVTAEGSAVVVAQRNGRPAAIFSRADCDNALPVL